MANASVLRGRERVERRGGRTLPAIERKRERKLPALQPRGFGGGVFEIRVIHDWQSQVTWVKLVDRMVDALHPRWLEIVHRIA